MDREQRGKPMVGPLGSAIRARDTGLGPLNGRQIFSSGSHPLNTTVLSFNPQTECPTEASYEDNTWAIFVTSTEGRRIGNVTA